MRTRYIFASEASVILASGLKVSGNWSPSNMATRTLISHIMDSAFVNCNRDHHRCGESCGRVVTMWIGQNGKNRSMNFRNAISMEVIDVVEDFELLLDACLGMTQGCTKIKSIGIQFVPCVKYLEIIGTAIYLE